MCIYVRVYSCRLGDSAQDGNADDDNDDNDDVTAPSKHVSRPRATVDKTKAGRSLSGATKKATRKRKLTKQSSNTGSKAAVKRSKKTKSTAAAGKKTTTTSHKRQKTNQVVYRVTSGTSSCDQKVIGEVTEVSCKREFSTASSGSNRASSHTDSVIENSTHDDTISDLGEMVDTDDGQVKVISVVIDHEADVNGGDDSS